MTMALLSQLKNCVLPVIVLSLLVDISCFIRVEMSNVHLLTVEDFVEFMLELLIFFFQLKM